MNTDLHEGWLQLEEIMNKRHGAGWASMSQGMQCAYYMGAMAAISSKQPKDTLWKQCETGLQDGMNAPNMRLVANAEVQPPAAFGGSAGTVS